MQIPPAPLADNGTVVAHAPVCNFSILLLDGQDVWHAEFHDYQSR